MSSRLTRPRRSRLYDASYNIGESYYKSALDNLDRKRYGRSVEPVSVAAAPLPPRYLNIDNTFDQDLQSARARAHRAITEEPAFDSRGSRVARRFDDDELDEDVQSSLSRIRASRKKMNSLMNDMDLSDSFDTINRRANIDLGDKLLGIAGADDVGSSIRSRALKLVSHLDVDDEPSVRESSALRSFKRTTISSHIDDSMESSAASMRAKATKARLADLETDMFERSEKQIERERRSANLKKILAENDIPEVRSIKKVTF